MRSFFDWKKDMKSFNMLFVLIFLHAGVHIRSSFELTNPKSVKEILKIILNIALP